SLIPDAVQFLQGSESNYNITYQNGSLSIIGVQPSSLTSAITSAVSTATTIVVTIATARRGMPGEGAAAAAAAAVSALLVSNMLELHTRKLRAIVKAVKLLEEDPTIADLEFCSGPVTDDCIAVRSAVSGPRGGQERVTGQAYLPVVERKVALLI